MDHGNRLHPDAEHKGHCGKEGQAQELAEHTMIDALLTCSKVTGMVDMVEAFVARHLRRAIAFMMMKRRHQDHRHEYSQEYPCRPLSSMLHLLHQKCYSCLS